MSASLGPCPFGLAEAILASPYLAVAVIDREMNIVWHNPTYARELGWAGRPLTGRRCYTAAGDTARHANCPAAASLQEGKYTRGLYDLGEKNAVFLTIPLPGGLAAKVFTCVPKEAGGAIESSAVVRDEIAAGD